MPTFTIGQMDQLGNALEAAGWNKNHITQFGQSGHQKLVDFLMVLEGRAKIVMESILTVKVITVPAIAGKKTADCFTNKSRYYYRDENLDLWLPEDQPVQQESQFSVHSSTESATFKQMVENHLGVAGEISIFAKLLKERGCIITLPVIESLIDRQEASEDVGLRTDGWVNFFLVEDRKGVSVVRVRRHSRRWRVSVDRLDLDFQWFAENRFFFCNLDTGSL